jgi:phage tail tape-measure protein
VNTIGKPAADDDRSSAIGENLNKLLRFATIRRIMKSAQSNNQGGVMKYGLSALVAIFLMTGVLGCSEPLSTREKGAGIGALGGAAAGGIIGAAVGRPGTGAAIGAVLGAGAGALIGDQLQG